MGYGIGRVPADVDPASEAWAELEAARIMAELVAQPRPRRSERVEWEQTSLYFRPFRAASEPDAQCAHCGGRLPALPAAPGGERVPYFGNGDGPALCVPCGRQINAERDRAALTYLLAQRDELRAAAVAIHLRGNDWQYGQRHWDWLVGHACLTLCVSAGLHPPSWWGDWTERDGPLQQLIRALPGEALPPVTPRERESCRCKQCGAVGLEGAYPFTTLPSSGLCDDCV